MVRKCYLCGQKVVKDKMSLHRFPTLPHIRKKWLDVCGLNDADDVNTLYICDCHFLAKYIIKMPTKSYLEPMAVPFISTTDSGVANSVVANSGVANSRVANSDVANSGRVNSDVALENATNRECNQLDDSIPSIKREYCDIVEICSNSDIAKSCVANSDVVNSGGANSDVALEKATNRKCNKLDDSIPNIKRQYCDIVEICSTPQELESGKQLLDTPVRRRFGHPRYISEIQEMDVLTPRGRKIILNFIKSKDQERLKKIRSLQYKNSYLKKRITSLQKMMSHVRKD